MKPNIEFIETLQNSGFWLVQVKVALVETLPSLRPSGQEVSQLRLRDHKASLANRPQTPRGSN